MIFCWQDAKESKKIGWEFFEIGYFEYFDKKNMIWPKKCDI